MELLHWLYWHLGVNGVGPYYGFWSGFGADVGEYSIAVTIFGSLYHAVRANNCEVQGCWRVGRHKTLAGHKVCWKHHPDETLTACDVVHAHEAVKSSRDQ